MAENNTMTSMTGNRVFYAPCKMCNRFNQFAPCVGHDAPSQAQSLPSGSYAYSSINPMNRVAWALERIATALEALAK